MTVEAKYSVYKKNSWGFEVTVTDDDGNPFDLTGYSGKFLVKEKPGDTSYFIEKAWTSAIKTDGVLEVVGGTEYLSKTGDFYAEFSVVKGTTQFTVAPFQFIINDSLL